MVIKRITLIVFLAASYNLVWQFYRLQSEWVALQSASEGYTVVACRLRPPRDEISRMYLEFFLLLALVGSRLRRLPNTLLTVIGLSGATITYMLWWQYVFSVASNAEVAVQSLPHFMYLWGGNALDLGIAFAVAALVVLNIRDAARSLVYGTG
jgi:hypothetical protein